MGQVPSVEAISEPYSVEISNQGKLTGITIKESENGKPLTHRFTQVRYGLPPTGDFRWKKPRELPDDYDYTGTYKEFGHHGAQPMGLLDELANRKTKRPSTEDITYLNIWVPASDKHKPANGWPVLVFFHGGWLQFGNPNHAINFDPRDLQNDDNFDLHYIIVAAGYRVSLFGFLGGKELLEGDESNVNFGFWDQRLALEWTYKYIKYFGGDPEAITCSGRSAGSYSTFFQLAYQLYHPEKPKIFKQVFMISNALMVQPKEIEESQEQFNEILDKFGISQSLSNSEKLAALKRIPHGALEDIVNKLDFHTFRAVTDGEFVSKSLLGDVDSGKFGEMMKDQGLKLIIGEVDNEPLIYAMQNTPKTLSDLELQLHNYYPKQIISTILEAYPKVDPELEIKNINAFHKQIFNLYGDILADLQVSASSRGFIKRLIKGGLPSENIYRYRVGYRPKCIDKYVDPIDKVPHASENHIWFYAKLDGFLPNEEPYLRNWMEPFTQLLNFKEKVDWDQNSEKQYREFKPDGTIEIVDDPYWDWGVKVCDLVYDVQLSDKQPH